MSIYPQHRERRSSQAAVVRELILNDPPTMSFPLRATFSGVRYSNLSSGSGWAYSML